MTLKFLKNEEEGYQPSSFHSLAITEPQKLHEAVTASTHSTSSLRNGAPHFGQLVGR